MGGKKGAKKGSSGKNDEEDDSTQRLYNLYGKKCRELGTRIPQKVREKFDEVLDEGEYLTDVSIPLYLQLNLWDPIGWEGAKALGESLTAIKFDKLKTLRFWKCGIEDNGLRYICSYLAINKSVEVLEILDNNITSLGCEFLGRVLKKEAESPITTLRLDHNPIHAVGVTMLAEGLVMNPFMKILSLNYCEIEKDAAVPLVHILIYIKSELKELYLKGNNLENEGSEEILKAVQVSKNLTKLDLADNKIKELGKDGIVVKQIAAAVTFENCMVSSYDLSCNYFDDEAVIFIKNKLEEGGLVGDFKLTIKLDQDFQTAFKKMLDVNKKKAKKAKKAKKKKGKKGKKK